jgi:hypothetical protein
VEAIEALFPIMLTTLFGYKHTGLDVCLSFLSMQIPHSPRRTLIVDAVENQKEIAKLNQHRAKSLSNHYLYLIT